MLKYMVTTGYQSGLWADWYPSIRGTTAVVNSGSSSIVEQS